MRLAEDSKCKFCNEDETAEHVMCKCEAYAIINTLENQNVIYQTLEIKSLRVS